MLDRLDELVVKPVAGSGGYGMLIGPHASDEELATFRKQIEEDPRGYIAQEIVQLSRHPTLVGDHLEGRHVDLRPFVLSGERIEVIPGRPHAGRAAQGLARRELVAGRRIEGHMGARPETWTDARPPRRSRSSGWVATWSAPRTPRACST